MGFKRVTFEKLLWAVDLFYSESKSNDLFNYEVMLKGFVSFIELLY